MSWLDRLLGAEPHGNLHYLDEQLVRMRARANVVVERQLAKRAELGSKALGHPFNRPGPVPQSAIDRAHAEALIEDAERQLRNQARPLLRLPQRKKA